MTPAASPLPRAVPVRRVAARRRSCSRCEPTRATIGWRSTSITSCIPRREAVVDGREAYDAPDADLSDRANFLWPMAAVLPVVPFTVTPARGRGLARDGARARLARRRALAAGHPRLAHLRRRAPLAVRDRRRADRQRVAAADPARRACLALPRPGGDRRPRARLRRRDEALPLAARRLVRTRRTRARGRDRCRRRRGIAAPPAALDEHRRTTCACFGTSPRRSSTTRTRRSRC